MEFVATLNPGLEKIALQEIEELLGKKAEVLHPGAVRFSAEEPAIFTLNYLSRSLHRVVLLLIESEFSELKDIYKLCADLEYSRWVYPTQTFAVRTERTGEHSFTSLDVSREIGQAIIDSFQQEKHQRLKVDLNNPNLTFLAEVRGSRFWLGLDTTGESLHKRWYRVRGHKAPLKTTLAYSMLRIAGIAEGKSVLDPFCGCGTIPIEAGLYLKQIPPGQKRDFAFFRFYWLDKSPFLQLAKTWKPREIELKIQGWDISERCVQDARKNAEEAGLELKFSRRDTTQERIEADLVVTDLPFGVRTPGRNLPELYRKFLENLRQGSWETAVLLTARPQLLDGYHEKIWVRYGDLDAWICIYKNK